MSKKNQNRKTELETEKSINLFDFSKKFSLVNRTEKFCNFGFGFGSGIWDLVNHMVNQRLTENKTYTFIIKK